MRAFHPCYGNADTLLVETSKVRAELVVNPPVKAGQRRIAHLSFLQARSQPGHSEDQGPRRSWATRSPQLLYECEQPQGLEFGDDFVHARYAHCDRCLRKGALAKGRDLRKIVCWRGGEHYLNPCETFSGAL